MAPRRPSAERLDRGHGFRCRHPGGARRLLGRWRRHRCGRPRGRSTVEGGTFEATEAGLFLDDSQAEISDITARGAEVGLASESSSVRVEGSLFAGHSAAAFDARSGSLRLRDTVIDCLGGSDGVRAREASAPSLSDVSIADCARVAFLWNLAAGEPSDVGTAAIAGEGLGASPSRRPWCSLRETGARAWSDPQAWWRETSCRRRRSRERIWSWR
jgi:hypothetical protein